MKGSSSAAAACTTTGEPRLRCLPPTLTLPSLVLLLFFINWALRHRIIRLEEQEGEEEEEEDTKGGAGTTW